MKYEAMIGESVIHKKHGNGKIVSVYITDRNQTITVSFDSDGTRTKFTFPEALSSQVLSSKSKVVISAVKQYHLEHYCEQCGKETKFQVIVINGKRFCQSCYRKLSPANMRDLEKTESATITPDVPQTLPGVNPVFYRKVARVNENCRRYEETERELKDDNAFEAFFKKCSSSFSLCGLLDSLESLYYQSKALFVEEYISYSNVDEDIKECVDFDWNTTLQNSGIGSLRTQLMRPSCKYSYLNCELTDDQNRKSPARYYPSIGESRNAQRDYNNLCLKYFYQNWRFFCEETPFDDVKPFLQSQVPIIITQKLNHPFWYQESFVEFEQFTKEFLYAIVNGLCKYMNAAKSTPFFHFENHENSSYVTQSISNLSVLEKLEKRINTIYEGKASSEILAPLVDIQSGRVIIYDSLNPITCNINNHDIRIARAKFSTYTGESVIIPVHKCNTCGRIFIGKTTLETYETRYAPIRLPEGYIILGKQESKLEGFSAESRLHSLGYNVREGNMTERERHELLAHIVDKNILSYFEICKTIEQNIHLFDGRLNYQNAVAKWKNDLTYISRYVKEK